ncbi:hypothetical protein [Sinisalibacter aestuarii]|uniref:Ferrochelatase n=1 Tax=Sinisalibacter aestuarii TaxID=2949426 RepID=A0ABQ5LNM4_9RHOB|nr:hypothetical protein [Sinisalibacter aestuarii]GKY86609.1 hypothetical protein STA1M1_04780 [Sinisalibacter aestuarii]
MKKLVLGAVFAAAASAATAGSLAEPVIEADVVVQQAATSSVNQHVIPPAFFVISVGLSMLLL